MKEYFKKPHGFLPYKFIFVGYSVVLLLFSYFLFCCQRIKIQLNTSAFKRIAFSFILAFFILSLSYGQYTTITGTGNWENTSSWTSTPDVATLSGTISSNSINVRGTITRTGNITNGNGVTVNGYLTVNGDYAATGGSLTVNSGGTLYITGNLTSNINIDVKNGGTIIVLGNTTINGGNVNLQGDFITKGDFSLTSVSASINPQGNLVVGSNFNFGNGSISVTPANQPINDKIYFIGANPTVTVPGYGPICTTSGSNCTYGNASDLAANDPGLITIISQVFGCLWGQPSSVSSCVGNAVSFSIQTSGNTYQWQVYNGTSWNDVSSASPYSGGTTKTLSISSTTLVMNGYKFRCVVSGASCSSSITSNSATLTVNDLPIITSQPTSVSSCNGFVNSYYNLSFTVGASGSALTYKWQNSTNGSTWTDNSNGYPYSGATTATLSINGWTTFSSNMFYRCVVTNSAGCSINSNPAVLAISAPSSAGVITGTSSVCKGQTGVAYSVPLISGATSYIWSYTGTGATISGTSNSITINFSSTATSGNLTVKGNSSCGTGIVSANYAITVNASPAISVQPVGATIASGASYTFSVTASGATTYQWRKDGVNISGATFSSFNIASAINTDAGSYDVVISNGTCSVVSSAATLIVAILAAPTLVSSDKTNICTDTGGNIVLTATGGSGTTLNWYTGSCGGTLIGTGTSLTLSAPIVSTTYYARWEIGSSYSSCANVAVTVTTITPGSLTSINTAICSNQLPDQITTAIGFPVSPVGSTFVWEYTTDLVSASPMWTVITGVTTENYTPTLSQTTLFRRQASSGVCSAYSSPIKITIKSVPTASIAVDGFSPTNKCRGDAINSTGSYTPTGGTTIVYDWYLPGNPSSVQTGASNLFSKTNLQVSNSGDYGLIVTRDGCTSAKATATITVRNPPSPTVYNVPNHY